MVVACSNRLQLQMNSGSTCSLLLCLLAIPLAVPACVKPSPGPRTAEPATLRDDEIEVGRIVEDVNAVESACEVTPAQMSDFVANCDRNVRDDCIRAGVGYWRGCGSTVDQVRGEGYLHKACVMGSLTACRLQAQAISESRNPRAREAAAILDRACRIGGTQACGDLGVVLTTRLRNPSVADQERGIALLFGACRSGYHVFCTRVATIIERKKFSQHYSSARMALEQACDVGYLDACYTLAITSEDGTLGIRDYKVAAALATEACRKDHQPSCNALGYMFVLGHGVTKDSYRAAQLFYASCVKHYAPACHSMGEAVAKGWGVGPDQQKAREFYQYACAIGSDDSCKMLAVPRDAPSSPELR